MPFSHYPNFFYILFAYPYLKVSRFLPIAYACLFSYLPQNVISNRNTLKKEKGFSFSNSTLLRIPNTINFSYLQKNISVFFDHVFCSPFEFIYSFLFICLYIQLSFFFVYHFYLPHRSLHEMVLFPFGTNIDIWTKVYVILSVYSMEQFDTVMLTVIPSMKED